MIWLAGFMALLLMFLAGVGAGYRNWTQESVIKNPKLLYLNCPREYQSNKPSGRNKGLRSIVMVTPEGVETFSKAV